MEERKREELKEGQGTGILIALACRTNQHSPCLRSTDVLDGFYGVDYATVIAQDIRWKFSRRKKKKPD